MRRGAGRQSGLCECGGKLAEICDIAIRVPATETFMVQEYHLPVYYAICAEVERRLFPSCIN